MSYSHLENWQNEQKVNKLSSDILKEIQKILSKVKTQGKPYYSGDIDGICGTQTIEAFSQYKKDRWLANPYTLGKTTAKSLLEESEGEHSISEQKSEVITKLNTDAGTKSGISMLLPTNEIVYSNQWIIPGIPLTWGEFTKNCSRKFIEKSHVANAIQYAKTWGWVRERVNEPIGMTSGYRPPNVNRSVGGASQSQHLYGSAGDIFLLSGNNVKLYRICLESPFGGIGNGLCKGFVHTDIRDYRTVFGYGC